MTEQKTIPADPPTVPVPSMDHEAYEAPCPVCRRLCSWPLGVRPISCVRCNRAEDGLAVFALAPMTVPSLGDDGW